MPVGGALGKIEFPLLSKEEEEAAAARTEKRLYTNNIIFPVTFIKIQFNVNAMLLSHHRELS